MNVVSSAVLLLLLALAFSGPRSVLGASTAGGSGAGGSAPIQGASAPNANSVPGKGPASANAAAAANTAARNVPGGVPATSIALDDAGLVREERKAWIAALEKIAKGGEKKFDWQPVMNTLAGALMTGIVTFAALVFSAGREAARERRRLSQEADLKTQEGLRQLNLARLEGKIKYADKLLDVRLKQLEEFFAPLHALLQQSKGVYIKLNKQLLKKDSANYREQPRGGESVLQIRRPDGNWYDWRLLDQMPPLKEDKVFGPLISEIIRIGKEMTGLIQKYGAFAVDEKGASDFFGQYLAHYAILLSVYNDKRTEPFDPGEHEIGYFPRELNEIVATRYKTLLQDLAPYFAASSAVLAELGDRRHTP